MSKMTDIPTVQKVNIEYEIASLRERCLAYLIDFLILFFGMILLIILGLSLGVYRLIYFWFLIILPFVTFYTLVSEITMNGQTVGKRLMNLKVLKLTGEEVSYMDYAIRWALRSVDIYTTGGAVATLLIGSTLKGQRLGEILSNTVTIKLQPKQNFSLNELLNIGTMEAYTPRYPAVRQFSEQDMLFIKSTLERYRAYPNEAHQKAIHEMAEHVKKKLDITEKTPNNIQFLKSLISDYIVLTRS